MSPQSSPLRLVLSSAEITEGRHRLTAWARAAQLPADLIEQVELAAYEAMANVADHAYAGADGELELTASNDPCGLNVTVVDRGHWQPRSAAPSTRGMGIPLIRRLTDRSSVRPGVMGTTVLLHWYNGSAPRGCDLAAPACEQPVSCAWMPSARR